MIYNFLVDCEKINSEYQLEILKQTNYIIVKVCKHQNKELKADYFKQRELIPDSLDDNQDYFYLYEFLFSEYFILVIFIFNSVSKSVIVLLIIFINSLRITF